MFLHVMHLTNKCYVPVSHCWLSAFSLFYLLYFISLYPYVFTQTFWSDCNFHFRLYFQVSTIINVNDVFKRSFLVLICSVDVFLKIFFSFGCYSLNVDSVVLEALHVHFIRRVRSCLSWWWMRDDLLDKCEVFIK